MQTTTNSFGNRSMIGNSNRYWPCARQLTTHVDPICEVDWSARRLVVPALSSFSDRAWSRHCVRLQAPEWGQVGREEQKNPRAEFLLEGSNISSSSAIVRPGRSIAIPFLIRLPGLHNSSSRVRIKRARSSHVSTLLVHTMAKLL